MTRTVVVTTSYPSDADDAAGHFVETEVRTLVAAGEDVMVLAPGAPRSVAAPALGLGGAAAFGAPGALHRVRSAPWRALAAAEFIVRARHALTRVAPARVIAHFLVPSGWPVAVAVRADLEVVVHGSDLGLVERLPGALRRRITGALVTRDATFRCVSHDLADRLARATDGASRDRTRIEAPPIDVSGVPSREVARARLRVAPDERLIAIVSRLVREKRVDAALSAAMRIGTNDRCTVVVVGDGPMRAELERVFGYRPVEGAARVRFVGHRPRREALTWIAASDLLVSASRDEGAPTVIREARALGVRVVAAPAGDLRRWSETDPGIHVTES